MPSLHPADPRADKELWCTACKSSHKPTEEHTICPTGGFPHLHAKLPPDLYIDFKGWRFRPPFHCMYCGIEVCPDQWAFSRSCGSCDVGNSHTARLHVFDRRLFAGPHELVDAHDAYFLDEGRFLSPADAQKYRVLNPRKPLFAERFDRCDQFDALRTIGRTCNCTCIHTVHPVANHAFGCPDNLLAPSQG